MDQITSVAKRVSTLINANSPTILTAVAVGGVLSTTVLAVRATPKAMQDISELQELLDDLHPKGHPGREMKKRDAFKSAWKAYIPAAAVGVVTVACILGANSIHTKRTAALLSAYTFTEKAFTEYQDKVSETIGATKEQKVRDTIAQDRVDGDPASNHELIFTGSGEVLCYDVLTGRYFQSSMETLRKAQNDFNAKLLSDGYASQNDFYSMVGLPLTKYGDELGWTTDKMLELKFSAVLSEESRPCLSMDYKTSPESRYNRFN